VGKESGVVGKESGVAGVQELQNRGGGRACERLRIPSCGLSPIVLVLVVDWWPKTEADREDGRKGKAEEASGGSSSGTTGKQPRTRTIRG
jgi:hypothetical protein